MENEFVSIAPYTGENEFTDKEICERLIETEFAQQQAKKNRDYCYFLVNRYIARRETLSYYSLVAYTLKDPGNLESGAKRVITLTQEETLHLHRIMVVREGELVDKIADAAIKVLDDSGQDGGTFYENKNISIIIKDLRLDDILIFEMSTEKENPAGTLRRDFYRHVYTPPGSYWAYGHYHYELINQTGKDLAFQKNYYRDQEDALLSPEQGVVKSGESFIIDEENFIGEEIPDSEIVPFIDFATKADYPEITDYVYQLYSESFEQKLADFAPRLAEELASLSSEAERVRYGIEFVQNKIYYLYNESEMDGHKPQAPQKTYELKQGDCKAKVLLLKIILAHLGIDSDVLLVNYQADFFLPLYQPSPMAFNHAILQIDYHGKYYYVDATMRNGHGLLENRRELMFLYYLPIKPGQKLESRGEFSCDGYWYDEDVWIKVKEDTAFFTSETRLLKGQADSVREAFKTDGEQKILAYYNELVYDKMCLFRNFDKREIDQYFSQGKLEITEDDLEQNKLTVVHKVQIKDPYYIEKGTRFLHYWDRGMFVNDAALRYTHKDFPFYLEYMSARIMIHMQSDLDFDPASAFDGPEDDICNAHFTHSTKTEASKAEVSIEICYQSKMNGIISGEEFDDYVKDNKKIGQDRFGLGVKMAQDSFFGRLKKMFSGK